LRDSKAPKAKQAHGRIPSLYERRDSTALQESRGFRASTIGVIVRHLKQIHGGFRVSTNGVTVQQLSKKVEPELVRKVRQYGNSASRWRRLSQYEWRDSKATQASRDGILDR
jgi:hypothetical protein